MFSQDQRQTSGTLTPNPSRRGAIHRARSTGRPTSRTVADRGFGGPKQRSGYNPPLSAGLGLMTGRRDQRATSA
eukprot:948015-Heterocapsa_arctica.AAC.1